MATKRISVTNFKGGSYKSTTTRNLAVVAARQGLDVHIFDFDEQGTLVEWIMKRPDDKVAITLHAGSLADLDDVLAVESDLVLIDTPPLKSTGIDGGDGDKNDHDLRRRLIAYSDLIIVPSGQGEEDLKSSTAWMDYLKYRNARYAALLCATNRRTRSFDFAKRFVTDRGHPLCPIDIPRFEDVPLSYSCGLGVAEIRGAKGAEDYESVWSYCREQIGLGTPIQAMRKVS